MDLEKENSKQEIEAPPVENVETAKEAAIVSNEEKEQVRTEEPDSFLFGEATLKYEEEDILNAIRIQQYKRSWSKWMYRMFLLLPVAVILGYAGTALVTGRSDLYRYAVTYALLLVFVLYIIFLAPKSSARRTFRQIEGSGQLSEPSIVRFHPEGAFVKLGEASDLIHWEQFREVIESPLGFALRYRQVQSIMYVPMRIFSCTDKEAFSLFLAQTFGKKYYRSPYDGKMI